MKNEISLKDKICREIGREFWEEIIYNEEEKAFYVRYQEYGEEDGYEKVIYLADKRMIMTDKAIHVNFPATPKLLRLVGKFYGDTDEH